MALPVEVHLEAYRGDTWAQTFRFLEAAEGPPVDLSTAELAASARSISGGPDITLVVAATGEPGELTVGLGPGAEAGRYEYDLEVSNAGVVTTWVRGWLTVVADITP